jgi:enoyl-CoA hydratase
MGGGVGVSVHGSHRVASERTVFAMPETGIGLFPDVGATWFLPRLPGEIGCFLGLTGHRLATADCLYTGLADVAVPSDQLPDLIAELGGAADAAGIDDILRRAAASFPTPDVAPPLAALRGEIDAAFAGGSIDDILARLDRSGSAFARVAAAALRRKSPTSLKVTLHQMREGARHTFDECMQLEYRLACRFMRGHDFFEGVRAVVIDKDNAPDWRPSTLDAVTDEMVAGYFAPLPEGELKIDRPPGAD